ncbi:MAG: thioredoxin [Pirellulaceae bacterium]|nr:thioredoxin [Pirellulaceae bacterium]
MSGVLHINNQSFPAEVLNSPIPVVVDFYASWCPPCRALSPLLERLAIEFAGKIRFVKIDSDEAPELAEAYGVSALPTLVFIQNGETVGNSVGLPQEQQLRSDLNKLVQKVADRSVNQIRW